MTFVIFLLPTCAMGATLPVLVTELTSRTGNVGVSTGNLYFVNTLGAALGAYAASDLLLPRWGLDGLSGLLSLGSETLWVRTFSFARESTPQSFSIVLAIYLFGIAAGAIIGGRLCKSGTDLIKIATTSFFAASVILALSPALVVLAMQAIRSMRWDDALELAAMSLNL